jgi:hypothetical protein
VRASYKRPVGERQVVLGVDFGDELIVVRREPETEVLVVLSLADDVVNLCIRRVQNLFAVVTIFNRF